MFQGERIAPLSCWTACMLSRHVENLLLCASWARPSLKLSHQDRSANSPRLPTHHQSSLAGSPACATTTNSPATILVVWSDIASGLVTRITSLRATDRTTSRTSDRLSAVLVGNTETVRAITAVNAALRCDSIHRGYAGRGYSGRIQHDPLPWCPGCPEIRNGTMPLPHPVGQ